MFKLRHRLMHAAPEDGGGGNPSDSLRDTISQAFESATPAPTPAPAPEKPVAVPDGTPHAGETPQQTAERVRDQRGRFAKQQEGTQQTAGSVAEAVQKAEQATTQQTQQTSEQQPDKQQNGLDRAPQSWKPGAREAWASLPPDVKQEVLRREHAIARTLQETAQQRTIVESLGQMHQRYAPVLEAENVDLLTAANNAISMVGRLRFGLPQEKAQIIATLVNTYGIDIESLDRALVGQIEQQPQAQPQAFQDPRVDQLLGVLQQAQQQRAEVSQRQAVSEVMQFGEGKEFFVDVRGLMADILEVASRQGIDMTLEQAYDRACQMHPDISRVVTQRAAAAQGQNSQQSTARAMAAASSIRSTPAVPPRTEPDQRNLRGDIEAAWDAAQRR